MNSTVAADTTAEEAFENELKPGTQLLRGQYTIEEFLNNGGFGITYLAKDSLNRMVVIKECFPAAICGRTNGTVQVRSRAQSEAFKTIVELFVEEARNLARLSHPNIVRVHQVFEDNDTAYMAMDFIEGPDLLEILESDHVIDPDDFEKVARKLLDAVGFIHKEGILHRDIAPDNILIGEDGNPVLIDFGAARTAVTQENSYLGAMRTVKDGYSPQEFYGLNDDEGTFSDLYSLAASLYHVMCKELPASAQMRVSAIANGDADPYVSIKQKVSGYSKAFLNAIDEALEVFPKDRMQVAEEWVERLDAARTPVSKRVTSMLVRPTPVAAGTKAGKKNGLALPLLLGSSALVAAGAGFFFITGGGEDAAPSAPATTVEQTAAVDQPATVEQTTAAETVPSQASTSTPVTLPGQLVTTTAEDFGFGDGDVQVTTPRTTLSPSQTGDEGVPLFAGQSTDAPNQQDNGAEAALPLATQTADAGGSVVNTPIAGPFQTETSVSFSIVGDRADPVKISTADGPIGEFLEPGQRILSVNGFPISSLEEVNRVIEATEEYNAGEIVTVAFGIENPNDGSTRVQNAELPTVEETVLANGVSFSSQQDGDDWVTTVISGAGEGASDLQTGDRVIAFMPNNDLIDEAGALPRLIEQELANGVDQLNLAVKRDGSMWLVTLPLASSN